MMPALSLSSFMGERNSGFGGGAPPPYVDPTSLANLGMWIDPADTASINHTVNLVNQINDKSGNARHPTSTLTQRPTTNTRTINGLNALDFSGLGTVMIGAAGVLAIPAAANTIFVVCASDNAGDAIQNIMNGLNAGSGLRFAVGFTATDFQCQNRTTSSLYTTQALVRSTTPVIIGFRRSGTSITPFINGVNGTPGTNAEDITLTQLNIGAQTNTGATNRFNGLLGDIVWYTDSKSDNDMDLVGNGLGTKWGVGWTNMGF